MGVALSCSHTPGFEQSASRRQPDTSSVAGGQHLWGIARPSDPLSLPGCYYCICTGGMNNTTAHQLLSPQSVNCYHQFRPPWLEIG